MLQENETRYCTTQEEKQGAETQHGKYVTGVNHQPVRRNGKGCRDAIQCKNYICSCQQYYYDKQIRKHPFTVVPYQHLPFYIFMNDRQEPCNKFVYGIICRIK